MPKCCRCKKNVDEVFPLQGYPYCRSCLEKTMRSAQSVKAVKRELSKGSTEEKIGKLDEITRINVGTGSGVKRAIMENAPSEMDKAIRKFQKEGKEVTVETLTAEAKSTPSFVHMCKNAGLEMSWFDELARERMKMFGLAAQ